jgi:hypothetical protein
MPPIVDRIAMGYAMCHATAIFHLTPTKPTCVAMSAEAIVPVQMKVNLQYHGPAPVAPVIAMRLEPNFHNSVTKLMFSSGHSYFSH